MIWVIERFFNLRAQLALQSSNQPSKASEYKAIIQANVQKIKIVKQIKIVITEL